MQILISPAKRMRTDTDSFPVAGLPQFLAEAEQIKRTLQKMPPQALQRLWSCGDAIAKENVERLREMDLRRSLTPAILAYQGIQYQYMAPGVFEAGHLLYIQEHLRILSGFYGLLRPFDGVTPYRLEMQARLSVEGARDLYGFWGDRLSRQLTSETDLVLNLASKEYSRAVTPYLGPPVRLITCTFGELREGRVVEKGTLCKMARGQMVRYLAEHAVTEPEEILLFSDLGYRYSPEHSAKDHIVFLKSGAQDRRGEP